MLQKSPVKAKACWTDHTIPDVWEEKVTKTHPHSKPIEMQRRLIAATTKDGDTVLDPAAGSYSVFEACRLTGRDFIGGAPHACPRWRIFPCAWGAANWKEWTL